MIKLSESGFALLKKCLEIHNPSLIPIIESPDNDDYSDDFYNELRGTVAAELCNKGFQPDYEPNAYGLELEALIDEIGRLFLYKIPIYASKMELNRVETRCECGDTMSSSQNYDIEYRFFSDREWMTIIQSEAAYPTPMAIPFPENVAWLCPKCKRIHIFKDDSMKRIALYELAVKE